MVLGSAAIVACGGGESPGTGGAGTGGSPASSSSSTGATGGATTSSSSSSTTSSSSSSASTSSSSGTGGTGGAAVCGDGVTQGSESCDDGNTKAGDGCSSACAFEATCGNGLLEPGESCDDGNTAAGDGCAASCQVEPGTVCGDAIDLNDPNKVTVAGNVVTYAGTTMGATNSTFGAPPSCSAGTIGVPRVVHRYRVGGHPAVLQIEAEGNGTLVDTAVWAYLDCQDPSKELACGEDGPQSLSGALTTGYLPAGTTVFIVVSGYASMDVGPYDLHITEVPATAEPASGTCAAPSPAGEGTWAGVTLATDLHHGSLTSACSADAPDAVYVVEVNKTSDLVVSASSPSAGYDIVLSVSGMPCGTGAEIACADVRGAGGSESLVARDLAAGTYYVLVGGFSAVDVGPYALSLSTVEVLSLGAACDPVNANQRCATGTICHAGTCQKPKDLLSVDFASGLAPFVVTDFGGDGQTWIHCDPAAGCTWDNTTGASSTDPYALVHDLPNTSLHGEILTSPELDAAGLTQVVVELDQAFEHATGSADLGAIELSTDGIAWSPVASYTTDQAGHAAIDISTKAAGKGAFYMRFRYDDQTTTGDPFAKGWRLDNVHIYGF
ncbi:Multiple EGF-like-domain protein 3 precursor [Minicystis rosea]|nr:Multiple EGF-like-domain protein 3 precursor [Minicystis rosea]